MCSIRPFANVTPRRGMVLTAKQERIMNLSIEPIWLSLAVIGTAFTHHAHAVEPVGLLSQTVVNYSDLNLNNPAGAAALYTRIAHAADLVCPDSGQAPTLSRIARAKCKAQAIRLAVENVHAPELTRYYALKSSHPIGDATTLAARTK
jgi:UrcA family protein